MISPANMRKAIRVSHIAGLGLKQILCEAAAGRVSTGTAGRMK
jgi:hypothetical protein